MFFSPVFSNLLHGFKSFQNFVSLSENCLVLPGGSVVKNLPAEQEIQVTSQGQEDLLEKAMATHSSILYFFLIFIFLLVGG